MNFNKLLVLIFLSYSNLNAQVFFEQSFYPNNKYNTSSLYNSKKLSDSTTVHVGEFRYFNPSTLDTDSFKYFICRYNRRGELMYLKTFFEFDDGYLNPLYLEVINDTIFISGNVGNYELNKNSALIMSLNPCLDVIKFKMFYQKKDNARQFLNLKSNNNLLFINSNNSIQSDTLLSTTYCFNSNLDLKWHSSFLGDINTFEFHSDKIFQWGFCYMPSQADPNVGRLKRNFTILDLINGQLLEQHIHDPFIDNSSSNGGTILKNKNSSFFLTSSLINQKDNWIYKHDLNGNVIKQLKIKTLEREGFTYDLLEIHPNLFYTATLLDTSFVQTYYGILIDSNLNLIKKKQLFASYYHTQIGRASIINNNILISGALQEKRQGTFLRSVLTLIDTNFNVVQRPSNLGFVDSLCLSFDGKNKLEFKNIDTVWIDTLGLRKNLKIYSSIAKQHLPNFNIYPNPSNGNFVIQFGEIFSGNIEVSNIKGEHVCDFKVEYVNQKQISNSNLSAGIYFLKITTPTFRFNYPIIIE